MFTTMPVSEIEKSSLTFIFCILLFIIAPLTLVKAGAIFFVILLAWDIAATPRVWLEEDIAALYYRFHGSAIKYAVHRRNIRIAEEHRWHKQNGHEIRSWLKWSPRMVDESLFCLCGCHPNAPTEVIARAQKNEELLMALQVVAQNGLSVLLSAKFCAASDGSVQIDAKASDHDIAKFLLGGHSRSRMFSVQPIKA